MVPAGLYAGRREPMCILIVLRAAHPGHPIVVAANRDERTDRKAAPPGLFVGARRRMLSPRDRVAGGTWLALDDRGWFAGITNLAGTAPVPGAPSRGHLPHLALDEPSLDHAVAMVRRRTAEHAHAGFQLVLCDGARTVVLRHALGQLDVVDWVDPLLVVTNEHAPGQLSLRGMDGVISAGGTIERRFRALATVLADRGDDAHHAVCKHGDGYGTVSSSLIAVASTGPLALQWRYAPGPPDVTPYREYGNLGRRLQADP